MGNYWAGVADVAHVEIIRVIQAVGAASSDPFRAE
jgi:hypothetical protein